MTIKIKMMRHKESMDKAIKSSVIDMINTLLAYIALMIISCVFGALVSILPFAVGVIMLSDISCIEIPFGSLAVFASIPAIELFIMVTDNIDGEAFLWLDLIFLVLWIASLAIIGCIENKLKLGLSGTEAFVISLGMPVAFVMIITVIAFTVIGVSKIAKGHKDR